MLDDIQIGPFTFSGGKAFTLNGVSARRWEMRYGDQLVAEKTQFGADAQGITQHELQQLFGDERAAFIRAHQPKPARTPNPLADGVRVRLVESTDRTGVEGRTLGEFLALAPIAGLARGLIDDRYATWAVSELGVTPMAADEFARLQEAHGAIADALTAPRGHVGPFMPSAWIAGLLPDEVLAQDAGEWRAPTSWELRHVVGEGSFTGVTGAQAAALVGVTPQNFRKYTARDGASTRQGMSFAMWHLLLHKLGVQRV